MTLAEDGSIYSDVAREPLRMTIVSQKFITKIVDFRGSSCP